jgi:aspartyl-tRNA(Asn)/glutamyl-tRNA(Gln) amidotransferase subunit A
VLKGLGADVREVSLPHTKYALAVYYIIAPSEASANLARYDGVKYGFSEKDAETMWAGLENTRSNGFGPEVKRRIMLGAYALSAGYYDAFYLKAQKVRTQIRQEFEDVFKNVDVLAMPTSPTTAFRIGDKIDDPLQMYLNDIFTIPANIAGIPGISIPAGLVDGLPVGLQFMAGIVNMSFRYICNGSSILSPILKAVVGEVGMAKTSTFLNTSSNSCLIRVLTFWAFR